MGIKIAVYGASGHTGRFVVDALIGRGFEPLPLGRTAGSSRPGLAIEAALDRALPGAAAVINCAGPFATTAGPVISAALRAGIPYVDVAAEIEANVDTFARFDAAARAAGVVVVPAMAFFGGLGDLLVTAAVGDWASVDAVHIAYGLSGWHPTPGTLAAGAVSRERRGGRGVRYAGGRLEYHDEPHRTQEWTFPSPLGRREVLTEFTMADAVTVPSHVAVRDVHTYMTATAAADLSAAASRASAAESPASGPASPVSRTSGAASRSASSPASGAASPASAQDFVVDVVVRSGVTERRASASGRDIYAVSAPLAVEAVTRILDGRSTSTGVLSAGAAFDARDFLLAMSAHLTLRL